MRKFFIIIFICIIGCKEQEATNSDKKITENPTFDFFLIQPNVSIEYIKENLGSPYKIIQNTNSTDFMWIDKNIELNIISKDLLTTSEIIFRINKDFKNYFNIPNPNSKTKFHLPEIGKLTFKDLDNYESPFGKRFFWEYYRGSYYPKYIIYWTISGAGTEIDYEFSSSEGIRLPPNTNQKAFQLKLEIEDLPNPKVDYLKINYAQ
jgi:hypothetical protein